MVVQISCGWSACRAEPDLNLFKEGKVSVSSHRPATPNLACEVRGRFGNPEKNYSPAGPRLRARPRTN